ncbi:3'(2'),5'-bisphosphate nucleotidase [Rhodovulum sp. PH10]|uniref:3'(2'),5'-bisphosphate nucleotidase CysQ n=1 Tax=Rhodovulum sp. PH10 TaxID=1187851 RepID=UPI00027C263D|nr:3'(2'),5'-bisphosphate nucleotidase CysQ [Rhodovulum sp. PH10]EJW12325.1 3'(2'),5'-bisphosphate nucleotidase [Rhodovulum sp. PH10]
MNPIDHRLADALTALVSQAGRAVLEVACSPLAVRTKADGSPVTEADLASEALLLPGLERLLPGVPVVSEESGAATDRLGDLYVVVDPLDGTKEFVGGTGEYTINVAVVENDRPVAGFVFLPVRGLLYRGRVGLGAERLALRVGEPAGQPVAIRARPRPADGMVATVSRSHLDERTKSFLDARGVAARIPYGSAAKFALIAEGAADVYPRLAPTCEWDVAAGHALLAAAGGTVLRPDGSPLPYGRIEEGFRVPAFVAWGEPPDGRQPA